jgi:hypothetical protein
VIRYVRSSELPHFGQNAGLVALGRWLGEHHERYDRVYVVPEHLAWQPDLFIAAFSGMTPQEFQQATRETITDSGFDFCTRLDKYRFEHRDQALYDWQASAQDEHWLVLAPGEAPLELGEPPANR